jgi:hypothetical protein
MAEEETMSRRTVRSILTGIALMIALMLALPSPSQAAGLAPDLRGGDLVSLAWHWLAGLWNGNPGQAMANKQLADEAAGGGTASGQGGTASSNAQPCGGDQGVCIDPNG